MSNIDKPKMRTVAEKCKYAGIAPVMDFNSRMEALEGFKVTFTPDSVLALLDEVEAAEKRNARAQSLLNSANTENVWEIIGRLKTVISCDYRSEAEIATAAGKGE